MKYTNIYSTPTEALFPQRLTTTQPRGTVAPREQPSAAWVAARDEHERRCGVRLVKYFCDTQPTREGER